MRSKAFNFKSVSEVAIYAFTVGRSFYIIRVKKTTRKCIVKVNLCLYWQIRRICCNCLFHKICPLWLLLLQRTSLGTGWKISQARQMNLFAPSIFLPGPTNRSSAPVSLATTSHYKLWTQNNQYYLHDHALISAIRKNSL